MKKPEKTALDHIAGVAETFTWAIQDLFRQPDLPLPRASTAELAREAKRLLDADPPPDSGPFASVILKEAVGHRPPIPPIYAHLIKFVRTLYEHENLRLPEIKDTPECRDELNELIRKLQGEYLVTFADACENAVRIILSIMPPAAFEGDAQNCLSLIYYYDQVPDLGGVITDICGCFHRPEALQLGMFKDLRDQLKRNIFDACGVPYSVLNDTSPKLKLPKDSDLSPHDLLGEYLKHTPIFYPLALIVPFNIPDKSFTEHCAILSGSGGGKTQLMQAMLLRWLDREDPPPMLVIDDQDHPKGLLQTIQRLDVFHPDHGRLKDRLLIISPEDEPDLNFFSDTSDTPEAEQALVYLFSALDASLSTNQATAVTFIMALMRQMENPSLDTLRELMVETPKTWTQSAYYEYMQRCDPVCQSFFETQFYSAGMKVTREAVGRRIFALMANRTFMKMFSSQTSCFNAADCMNQRKIVLINASNRRLGDAASVVFARFFISQMLAGAIRRGSEDLALLVIDESGPHLDHQAERILRVARKYGLGLMAATQDLATIKPEIKSALFTNTSVKMVSNLSHNDTNALAREMRTSVEMIQGIDMPKNGRAQFACYVRAQTPSAIKLTIPLGQMESRPRMSDADHARMRERNRAHVKRAGVARAQATPTQHPHPAPKPVAQPTIERQTSDIDLAITTTRRIETLLTNHYGATGRGLHLKLDSVEAKLPAAIIHKCRYIASIRNQTVHNDNFSIPDRDQFVQYAEAVDEHFASTFPSAERQTHKAPLPGEASREENAMPADRADTPIVPQPIPDQKNNPTIKKMI